MLFRHGLSPGLEYVINVFAKRGNFEATAADVAS